MSKREVRALRQALAEELPTEPTSRLRWGRSRATMDDGVIENRGESEGQDGEATEAAGTVRRESEGNPEMESHGAANTEVHQLLEQVARLRELLSGKEAELAEAKSELTFVRGDAEAARQEVETARQEAAAAKREVETVREQLEEVDTQMVNLQKEHQSVTMEFELQRLRDREDMRSEFDKERQRIRETREHEIQETREWRKEVVAERNRLRDRVEHLEEQLAQQQHDAESTTTQERQTAEEPASPLDTTDCAEETVMRVSMSDGSQDLPDPQTSLEDASASSAGTTEDDPAPERTVQFRMGDDGGSGESGDKRTSLSPAATAGDQAAGLPQHRKNSTARSIGAASGSRSTLSTTVTTVESEEPMSMTMHQPGVSHRGGNKSQESAISENREDGEHGIMTTVTRLLEAQRHIMEAQVQALATQGVPPLRRFSGENINTDEGSVDRWIEQFEERARIAGWSDTQKLFQLKAHLEKMAEHTVRMLPDEEKASYDKVVLSLKKRFCPVDIEELRGLEFHQLMQSKQSVEELGVELQKLGRKAFPTSGAKEFDRIVKGRFYQALLPKWQRKLGAPKATETFEELFARARTLERHEQQFASARGEPRQKEQRSSKPTEQTPPQPTGHPDDSGACQENVDPKSNPGQSRTKYTGRKRGCFNCGDFNHLRRNCPNNKPEASRRSGGVSDLSTKCARREADDSPPGEKTENCTLEEESVHQLEQLLATMRLNMEKAKLQKSSIDTVVADAVTAVGPAIFLDVEIEGCPVKAVVDTGAQSTIISRDQLHQIANTMRNAGREVPTLVTPSAKLYGRSGSGRSELTITAEVLLQVKLDSHLVTAPVFVQPGSDIPCLLGTNVLPLLGVKFLRSNGVPLVVETEGTSTPQETPLAATVVPTPATSTPTATQIIVPDPPSMTDHNSDGKTNLKAEVRIVRSTFIPPRMGKMLEVELQVKSPVTADLYFEPSHFPALDGLEMAESVVTASKDGKFFIPIENHASLSQCIGPETCVGQATPLPEAWEENSGILDTKAEVLPQHSLVESVGPDTPENETKTPPLQCAQQDRCENTCFPKASKESGRLEKLYEVLSLENGEVTQEQCEALKQLIVANADVFALSVDELGHTDLVQHQVDTGNSPPIKQPVRRVPFFYRDKIASMVEEMEQLGVIRKSSSAWSSPVVLIPKKDGSYRFCVDYRKLNSVTKKDVYPLPRIDDILDTLSGAKFFSTLDLAAGYWQIGLDTSTSAKSAFVTHQGLHEFVRMPFGMCNAPATFQRLMEVVLAGLLWKHCFVYIDDVLVCSNTFEEHLIHLEEVLSRLQQAGLRVKAKKCVFLKKEVSYLGHVITRQGIKPDAAKTEKIRDYPAPADVSQVRQFLGLASYYRRFVPGFASIAAPLHLLLKKDAEFHWSSDCSEAFASLKEALIRTPVLAYPQFNSPHPFIVETDASTKGLGAVLTQQGEDGKVHPIAFASRSLNKAEKNYAITELETLGLVWAVKTFRPYILGRRCIVFTDHAACTALLTSKHPSSKLVRWAMTIQEFNLDIRHRAGKSNRVADALSRNPVEVSQVLQFQSVQPSEVNILHGRAVPVTEESLNTPELSYFESDIKQLQRQDPQLAPLVDYHEKGMLPSEEKLARRLVLEAELYEVVDGVLFFVSPSNPYSPRLAVPQCLRQALIKEHHDGKFAGHFAERKIYSTMSIRYWWKGMRSDISKFCRSCLVCASRKGTGRKQRPPLQPIPVGGPFEMVGVDVLQLPLSRNGNQYAIVFQDYLTKWPEVFATPDQRAETIARLFVEQVVTRHGVPERLLSDRGPNFLSELMQEVCQLLGTTKVNTSGYHPQCDGLVEKFNSTLINMLSKSVNKYGHDWDLHLPYVLFAYRAAVQDSTQVSPFYMLYGREPVLPQERALTLPRTKYQVDLEDYTDELAANMSDAWSLARDNLRKAQKRQKCQYDRKSKQQDLKVGDKVMVYFPNVVRGKAWKFARPYYGPYVIESLTPTNAAVRLVDRPSDDTIFVALDRVRPCYAEMTDDVWVGHGTRRPVQRTRKQPREVEKSGEAKATYTGPITRSKGHAAPNTE